ncbi:hypothetical protein [Bradyrhizobium sp. SZCCHNR1098]|uniref:hypothetical protein n=1 Tax=Bradyrhizobium sp. SZCCHNR1098 TaxID=3057370 RepID=UPI002915DE4A|nr:hypothetical protein [Bradyrhizobium sp. SZCCHNR1098]
MTTLAELEKVKVEVERRLPPEVVSYLQSNNFSLTISSSNTGTMYRPVLVDQNLADEIAEEELVEEMVSYRKNVTGIDNTIFISPKGKTQHAARVKVAINPPDSISPHCETASVAISDGSVKAGNIASPALLQQVTRFIELNREVLMDYWEYRILTDELQQRLRPIS